MKINTPSNGLLLVYNIVYYCVGVKVNIGEEKHSK